MHARAYVLIEAEAGQVGSVIAALRGLPGIRAADIITGPYDIIAVIELPEQRLIGRLVMDELHGIAGIKRTITCLAI
jgi:DNA-binding Lrp family transcriptional regulator